MPKTNLVLALLVLAAATLSCTFLKDKFSNTGNGSVKAPSIPPFDPNGPMVSPGAYVIRIMAKDEPALAALADQIEVAERKMMRQIIDENRNGAQPNRAHTAFTTSPLPAKGSADSQMPPAAAHLM